MKRCRSCGGSYRTGVRAYVATPNAGTSPGIVCPKCARRGALLVPAPATLCGCGAPATVCQAHAKRSTSEGVKLALRELRARLAGYQLVEALPADDPADDFTRGLIESLIGAIATLERFSGKELA